VQASLAVCQPAIVVEAPVQGDDQQVSDDSQSSEESDVESLAVSETEAGPSKRPRIARSPPSRYFAATPAKPDNAEISGKRKKRFSPSAPASEAESDEENSSAEEDENEDDVDVSGVAENVDEGRVRWSVPTTPTSIPAGSSRAITM
jgi:hypothetical protein